MPQIIWDDVWQKALWCCPYNPRSRDPILTVHPISYPISYIITFQSLYRLTVRFLAMRLHVLLLLLLLLLLLAYYYYYPNTYVNGIKDHRQRIPRFVIKRHLEKPIQKKLFLPFTIITNKDYFPRKKRL